MAALVQRDDLSQRTALSKSALTAFDICQHKSWFDIHYREPLIPQERITFGSVVDAGVENVIKWLRMGQPVQMETAYAAAAEIANREGEAEIKFSDAEKAIDAFMVQVAPHYDFSKARLQHHFSGEILELGEVDGHPDVWLPGDGIYDVKAGKSKLVRGVLPRSVELGFYALLAEQLEHEPVTNIGYWTWNRYLTHPKWEIATDVVTEDYLQWTVERAAAYVRAKRADEVLNAKAEIPNNWSMTGAGQAWACATCQYAYRCPVAVRGDDSDVAA